jgi:hypothetical protein
MARQYGFEIPVVAGPSQFVMPDGERLADHANDVTPHLSAAAG